MLACPWERGVNQCSEQPAARDRGEEGSIIPEDKSSSGRRISSSSERASFIDSMRQSAAEGIGDVGAVRLELERAKRAPHILRHATATGALHLMFDV